MTTAAQAVDHVGRRRGHRVKNANPQHNSDASHQSVEALASRSAATHHQYPQVSAPSAAQRRRKDSLPPRGLRLPELPWEVLTMEGTPTVSSLTALPPMEGLLKVRTSALFAVAASVIMGRPVLAANLASNSLRSFVAVAAVTSGSSSCWICNNPAKMSSLERPSP